MTTAWTRRNFCGTTARLALGAGVAAGPWGRIARAAEKRRYIDVHTHVGQPWHDREPVTADRLLAWMDEHAIEQAAVLPLVSPEAFYYPVTTEYVLAQTKAHRDRLIPFCAIDPRTAGTHLRTPESLVGMLRRYVDAGARGFGEHKPRLPIDDPLSRMLYAACGEVRLPVLFHLDNFANMDQPGLPGLARMLAEFPATQFIGHGKGWWASISGGLQPDDLQVAYPEGPVRPGGAIDALMEKHPNLHGDLSSSGAHAVLRDPEFGRAFLLRRADRLLFGTDYYEVGQEFAQFGLFDRIGVPAEVEAKICRDNARRLFAR